MEAAQALVVMGLVVFPDGALHNFTHSTNKITPQQGTVDDVTGKHLQGVRADSFG